MVMAATGLLADNPDPPTDHEIRRWPAATHLEGNICRCTGYQMIVAAGAGPLGRRAPSADFFTGFWSSVMEPDEMLVEIRVPRASGAQPWGYQKFTTRSQDWATVAVAASGGRVALASMADRPLRAVAVESALASGASVADAAALAAEGTEPSDDLRASADYRRHLARVLTERALTSP
jgi:aerobic carbon-monoxide dehydrogenase medium subunit